MSDETRSHSRVRIDDLRWGRYLGIPLACPGNRERYNSGLTVFKALGEPHDFELIPDGQRYRLHVRKTGLGPAVLDEATRDRAIAIAYGDPAMIAAVKNMSAEGPVRADPPLDFTQITKLWSLIHAAGGKEPDDRNSR